MNPMDKGNLGTILRTALGFEFNNVIIIKPCCDVLDPKTIRASQGSIFALNIKIYDSYQTYAAEFINFEKYFFVLTGNIFLNNVKAIPEKYSLLFGNESSGIPLEIYQNEQNLVTIKHSNKIDSLNLANSVSIALFYFAK
jgi:TrmH family RNA methyltransferase